MPKKMKKEEEFETESESDSTDLEQQQTTKAINIDEEISKARQSMKNIELTKQEKELAKQLKRERLAKSKEYPPVHKKSGKFEKGSPEAIEWAAKMQLARKTKKEARDNENKKQEERDVLTKTKLEEVQEAKILALQHQIDEFHSQTATPIEIPVKVKRTYTKRKAKKVVSPIPSLEEETETEIEETETETETETEPEPEPAKAVKKKNSKRKLTKAIAHNHIEEEKKRIEDELYLQQMRSVIPNFGK